MTEPTPTDTTTMSAVPSAIASAAASAVGTPQSIPPMDPEERAKSINVSLADLTAKATALYQSKKYDEAAEVFSQATEMQAELNGEMAPENADVLFLYGRCLFRVGQSKSDVLGGKAPAEKKPKKASQPKAKAAPTASSAVNESEADKTDAEKVAEEGVAAIAKNASGSGIKDEDTEAKKPLFQFTGDENFEDSDEDEAEEGAEDGAEEEEDDDLAVAFEILELSRLLFEKRLEQINAENLEEKGAEKIEENSKLVRHVKERLADTHDLLAEISLENEKFPEAIKDGRATLKYKTELYSEESEMVAEAHFKLSLALEFASVTTTSEDAGDASAKTVDENLRTEAAEELEKAIASTQLKLKNKEVDLAMMHAPEDNDESRKQIAEVKELIAEMEQRLVDLRKAPMDVEEALGKDNPLSGILGKALGESAAEQERRVEEAKKSANDLSGLVRKKTKEEPEKEAPGEANGKRKAEAPAEGQEEAKKTKVDTPAEA
ncbi:histone H1-binding protein [Xylariaceae sp. FL0804]|nr:histone H1-binding protein [Xylariaceae sp. FL0804]